MLHLKIYNFEKINAVCNTERRLGLPASLYNDRNKCYIFSTDLNLHESVKIK